MFFKRLREDIAFAKKCDPAARSKFEIYITYSGVHALSNHRFAHFLHTHKCKFLARCVSQFSKFMTGIEIHPGATIGEYFFIDHGTGIVIGETAIVGNDVLIYQGVVLGGTSLSKGKRHPTVEDAVVIGSGAKVLGNITLGCSSKVGAGAVVLQDVPRGATAVGVPSRIIHEDRKCVLDLEHEFPDPVSSAIDLLLERQEELENRINVLSKFHDIDHVEFDHGSELEEVFKGDGKLFYKLNNYIDEEE